jgi:RNA polymerase sporulation-specific sigma factor
VRDIVLRARENNEEKYKLAKSFEPLIKKCIRIYVQDKSYYEDAMQEGYITVFSCIKRYDINSAFPFAAYVKRSVIYSIRDFSKGIKSELSLNEESDEGGSLMDILQSDTDIEGDYLKGEDSERLKAAMDSLALEQRRVIEEFFLKNRSMREISKNKRCHYMSIVQLKDRAIKKLKDELMKKGS